MVLVSAVMVELLVEAVFLPSSSSMVAVMVVVVVVARMVPVVAALPEAERRPSTNLRRMTTEKQSKEWATACPSPSLAT